jgi:diguanylate cyclase (GGDEF)-like protein
LPGAPRFAYGDACLYLPVMENTNKPRISLYTWFKQGIGWVADTMIPEECRLTDHETLRSRVLTVVMLSLLLCLCLLYVGLSQLIPFSHEGARLADYLVTILSAGTFLTLLVFKVFKSRKIAANLFGVILWSVFFQTASFTGGIETPSLSLFILLPVLLGVTSGTRAGLYWTVAVCATWLTLLLLNRSGYEFTQIIVPRNYNTALTICLSLSCLLVVIVVVQYEFMNHMLRDGLARERENFEFMARHDQLTGLPNRRSFIQHWDMALARASRSETRVAILFLDLDKFKVVNDGMGHNAGDLLLQEMSLRLQNLLRATDFVARWGGDEFAMIVENVGGAQDLEQVAAKLVATIKQPMSIGGESVTVGVSIGCAVYPDQSEDGSVLERLADQAMYEAKHSDNGFVLCVS